jgi:DNA-binding SARP family transcriptional activator
VALAYRVLGPVEAAVDGELVSLGGTLPRAVLAVLLLHAGEVVSTDRLADEVWPEGLPAAPANSIQGYVSSLRKQLGREAIETRGAGYVVRPAAGSVDLHRFERLAADGAALLRDGRPEDASALLGEALGLWRGPALVDLAAEGVLRAEAARLDELRLVALERRIEADLERGLHADVVGELQSLVAAEPLREHPRGLLMLALYRSGRQADALAEYRAARTVLVEELGIEPGERLQELEVHILRQDASLAARGRREEGWRRRSVLACALVPGNAAGLIELAEPLAREADAEVIVAATVAAAAELEPVAAALSERRGEVLERGARIRAAAFVSLTPGIDLARIAVEQEADLLLVDAPAGLLEDARLLTLLTEAPCDVAVVVDGEARPGPVLVPFTGAPHDWAAVELGAWLARSIDAPLELAGSSGGTEGRDASRSLANASLAVQRALGVDARPVLVAPSPDALVAAAAEAAYVVVGLTERWRHEGLGRTRTALAGLRTCPTLLVRRGLRPGGLAPNDADTRFTWTVAV